jgi:CHASE3 domain sensor protein
MKLTRQQIRTYVEEVATLLAERGTGARTYLVGGAAMMLGHYQRDGRRSPCANQTGPDLW